MSMALFILILFINFKRTINRLTKPVSALIAISLLSSALISAFYYLKEIEGELFLSNYLKIFENTNLILHLSFLHEKILLFFSLAMTIVIGILVYKLPRREGFVSFMVSIGFISSLVMFAVLLQDFSSLI